MNIKSKASWAAQRSGWPVIPLLVLSLAGCQFYHNKPLTPQVVKQVLRPPPWRELRVAVEKTSSEQLNPTALRPTRGITPDTAAALAVILNPSLRALRALHGEASAQLLQAGILTNPQLSTNFDFVTGGYRTNTFNDYGIGVSWNIQQLIDRQARISAANYGLKQVDLEVAWREWQTAEAAKLAVYDIAAAQAQLQPALAAQSELNRDYHRAKRASARGLITLYGLGTALNAREQINALVLRARQRLEQSRLALARTIGLGPRTSFTLSRKVRLPTVVRLPDLAKLEHGLQKRRLDLLALRMGYQSQQEALRAAVLRQFPRIAIGFDQASDDTNIHTTGFGVILDLPIFDRNQGEIALAKATRRFLFHQYIARVFAARQDIALAAANTRALQGRVRQAQAAARRYQKLVNLDRQALRRGGVAIQAYADAVDRLARERILLARLQRQFAGNLITLELSTGKAFITRGRLRLPPPPSAKKIGDTP